MDTPSTNNKSPSVKKHSKRRRKHYDKFLALGGAVRPSTVVVKMQRLQKSSCKSRHIVFDLSALLNFSSWTTLKLTMEVNEFNLFIKVARM
jgi:hypothetical protein